MPPRVQLADVSEAELRDLDRVIDGEMTVTTYKDKWKRGHEVLDRVRAQRLDERGEQVAGIHEGVIPDDVLDTVSFQNGMWQGLESLIEEYDKLNTERMEVNIRLKDRDPVLIVFLSDLHIGHVKVRMRKLREDLEAVKATDGCYVVLGGDITDNVVTGVASRGMHHEQLTNVEIQKYLADEFVSFLGADKILAMLLGNHDEWSLKNDDFDPIKYLAKQVGCAYLGAFGYVNVELGSEEYRILAAHQFRMNSSFNKTHAPKRLMDFVGDADVVFTGHKHDAAAEVASVRREKRFFAQAGTYLKSSLYSRRLGFTDATPEMPGVILFPDQRRFVGVYSAFDEGLEILKGYRS